MKNHNVWNARVTEIDFLSTRPALVEVSRRLRYDAFIDVLEVLVNANPHIVRIGNFDVRMKEPNTVVSFDVYSKSDKDRPLRQQRLFLTLRREVSGYLYLNSFLYGADDVESFEHVVTQITGL